MAIVSSGADWLQLQADGGINENMNEFLTTFSSDHSIWWALSVMGAVLAISLLLYGFWEVVIPVLDWLWPGRKNAKLRGTKDVVP